MFRSTAPKRLIQLAVASFVAVTLATAALQSAAAEEFQFTGQADEACFETEVFYTAVGSSSEEATTPALSLPAGPGPVLSARLTWVGADDSSEPVGQSTLTINDQPIVGTASGQTRTSAGYDWYSWYADIGPDAAGLVTGNGESQLTLTGWDIGTTRRLDDRNGAELVVTYDVGDCSPKTTMTSATGIDYIHASGGYPRSSVLVVPVEPQENTRYIKATLGFWGAEIASIKCRSTALWMLAGSGEVPDADKLQLVRTVKNEPSQGINDAVEIVDNPFHRHESPCETTLNPTPDRAYAADHSYPQGAVEAPYRAVAYEAHTSPTDAEIAGAEVTVEVPPNISWIAFQIESQYESYGESGAWASATVQVDPIINGSIGDFVWLDGNRNGVQDKGEVGVSEVAVRLWNASGALVAETTTDTEGYYHFTQLPPGYYRVDFEFGDATVLSPPEARADTTSDSNGSADNLSDLNGVTDLNSDLFAFVSSVESDSTRIVAATEWFGLGLDEHRTDIDQGITTGGDPNLGLSVLAEQRLSDPADAAVAAETTSTNASSDAGSAPGSDLDVEVAGEQISSSTSDQLAVTGSWSLLLFVLGGVGIALGAGFICLTRPAKRKPVG